MCRSALVVSTVLILTLSCASSGPGPVSDRQWYDGGFDRVWAAAVRAMADIGADIAVQSRASGMLAGTLDMVELGGRVRIDVSVRRTAGASSPSGGTTDVSAAVGLEGRPNDDPELRDDLAVIRDRYMSAVDHHMGAFRR
jgi:hypothetical protein